MVGFIEECQYCGCPTHDEHDNSGYNPIMLHFGVSACVEHKDRAQRDGNAWLHRNNLVDWDDATEDPVFALLLNRDIKVRRTSGTIEDGWRIEPPTYDEPPFLVRSINSGRWSVKAINRAIDTKRSLHVEDFKLSLPEADHALVDAFVERLNRGFYKADSDAYDALEAQAQAQAQAADDPHPPRSLTAADAALIAYRAAETASAAAKAQVQAGGPLICLCVHPELGVGRVFMPPLTAAAMREEWAQERAQAQEQAREQLQAHEQGRVQDPATSD